MTATSLQVSSTSGPSMMPDVVTAATITATDATSKAVMVVVTVDDVVVSMEGEGLMW